MWGRVASSFPRRIYLPSVSTRYQFAAGWTVGKHSVRVLSRTRTVDLLHRSHVLQRPSHPVSVLGQKTGVAARVCEWGGGQKFDIIINLPHYAWMTDKIVRPKELLIPPKNSPLYLKLWTKIYKYILTKNSKIQMRKFHLSKKWSTVRVRLNTPSPRPLKKLVISRTLLENRHPLNSWNRFKKISQSRPKAKRKYI